MTTGDAPGPSRTARLWQEIAPSVFVRRYVDYNVNVGLIVGEDGAMLVDTRGSERQGRELADEVMNTHHHYDHCFGNTAFASAEIWGHEDCARRIREDSRTVQLALAAAMPEVAGEYLETQVVPPGKTFRDRIGVDLGRAVELVHLGRGHTDNDVVVGVPDAGILFAGDLIEQGAPPWFEDSYPMDWPRTLERMLGLAKGPVVPGHGEVVGRAFVEGQLADLSALAELAAKVRFDGGSINDALPLSPFPARVARIALARAFAQLGGEI
jgi:glyoxylase-like metal-dependent hydrolase (beta-lactamase superfamily II)